MKCYTLQDQYRTQDYERYEGHPSFQLNWKGYLVFGVILALIVGAILWGRHQNK